MDRYQWTSAVSDCEHPSFLIAGYRLPDIIGHLTYTEVLFLCLRGRLPSAAETRMLDSLLCAIVDYSIGPAPFAARVVASANPQMGAAMAAGILAQGDYAIAPQDAGRFIQWTYQQVMGPGQSEPEAVRTLVADLRSRKERIPGIGHPSHHGGDPRAERLRAVAEELGFWGAYGRCFAAVVAEYNAQASKQLAINVDGMMACLLLELGFTPAEMAGVAALSTLPGIIANVAADLAAGVRIRQVQGQVYTGPAERDLPPEYLRRG